jgi:hypothetical protein
MNPQAIHEAASLIWRSWIQSTRIAALPASCCPANRAEGYAIQSEVARLSGQRILGWKIAATSVAGQRHIHVDGPLAGRLLASKVLPDGAALWILAGHKKKDYQVAARFVSFMLKPQVQLEWVRATGYLPMTPAAIEALKAAGVAPTLLEAATRRLSERKSATVRAKHGAGLNLMREILNEEIAAVWADAKPAKEALDTATRRFNAQPAGAGPASSGR